ncbi:hypothetical protein R1flu_027777 [Riccia fluitans]|uniref:Uncharacterized protein n=1 Tax=Riccia fluitans TaxID=41844 RepID=A0ABD1XJR7_9MARC
MPTGGLENTLRRLRAKPALGSPLGGRSRVTRIPRPLKEAGGDAQPFTGQLCGNVEWWRCRHELRVEPYPFLRSASESPRVPEYSFVPRVPAGGKIRHRAVNTASITEAGLSLGMSRLERWCRMSRGVLSWKKSLPLMVGKQDWGILITFCDARCQLSDLASSLSSGVGCEETALLFAARKKAVG